MGTVGPEMVTRITLVGVNGAPPQVIVTAAVYEKAVAQSCLMLTTVQPSAAARVSACSAPDV